MKVYGYAIRRYVYEFINNESRNRARKERSSRQLRGS